MIGQHRKAWELVQASTRPVIVFQMGKVASSSIVEALREYAPNDVFHVHRMEPSTILAGEGGTISQDHEFLGLALFHHVVVPKRPANIITLVRDPIARNLSAYFHRPRNDYSVQAFLDRYDQSIPLDWFDRVFRPSLGIDVYSQRFNYERGWSVVEHPLWPTLILRAEEPNRVKAKVLARFTDLPVSSIPHANQGAQKEYADSYRRFKRDVVFPEDYVDRMLGAKLTAHFYTEAERRTMRDRWTGAAHRGQSGSSNSPEAG